jgi:hypothetical protein
MKTCTVTTNCGPPTEFQIPELGDPCEKCRAKPSTQEVMIMVERPGGVVYYCDECAAPPIAPAPQWSTEPPREPGWYWRRRQIHTRPIDYGRPQAIRVYQKDGALWDDFGELPTTGDEFLEWWPVRIEPPR